MRAKNTNKMRQFSSLLNEHWKRKQRLKDSTASKSQKSQELLRPPGGAGAGTKKKKRRRKKWSLFLEEKTIMIDIFRASLLEFSPGQEEEEEEAGKRRSQFTWPIKNQVSGGSKENLNCPPTYSRHHFTSLVHTPSKRSSRKVQCATTSTRASNATKTLLMFASTVCLLFVACMRPLTANGQQTMLQSDPRPTIYSGQVSFGLLLSAHSSLGTELTSSASYQVKSVLAQEDSYGSSAAESATSEASMLYPSTTAITTTTTNANYSATIPSPSSSQSHANSSLADLGDRFEGEESKQLASTLETSGSRRKNRQIFERTGQFKRQQQQQQQQQLASKAAAAASNAAAAASEGSLASGLCSQINANALYAGMGAIWASHQANLVGDSHLAIGTYVYDSCNDLDIGQRQSVRIVSNLNAFQQTTCESPRGAPISLTIAHGDNQLRAIQLLTSFRVPVITTKEHFDLEDYSQLSRDQRRFLFTTAPSSRHLAVGALRFSKRIVSRSTSSPKLPNHFYKMSSKNGLIVISRNLPARFIAYLVEMIPLHVNYEMLQSNQPIDQIRSIDALESILIKSGQGSTGSGMGSSESRPSGTVADAPAEDDQSAKESRARERWRHRRAESSSDDDRGRHRRSGDDSGDDSSGEYETPGEADGKMLSPTILMFITPSEAIDLVTRLRNDLAEVSRYYSLIVTTREDISPALKTIFHRGGSRLCSGKAFYTISPKPDDIGEFSRYFRDTVQMEGESSDHPLICEFAKYQSSNRMNADLDEISTEPVIKAVWTAAAAFKSVHRRECAGTLNGSAGSPGGGLSGGNVYRAGGDQSELNGSGGGGAGGSGSGEGGAAGGRVMNSRQPSKSHSECMVKMNKNMATLVQRALKRLDVYINSTGLQSLDGFRLKFDEMNELMTNKFSVKYINKECEITEIGQYSGLKDSGLRLDEELLVKSLESALPDAWPVRPPPPPPSVAPAIGSTGAGSAAASSAASGRGSAANSDAASTGGAADGKDSSSAASDSADGPAGDSGNDSGHGGGNSASATAASTMRGKRKLLNINRDPDGGGGSSSSSAPNEEKAGEEEDSGDAGDKGAPGGDSGDPGEASIKPRTSKRSRLSSTSMAEELIERLSKRKLEPTTNGQTAKKKKTKKERASPPMAAPVTAMGGRGIMPGVTDTTEPGPAQPPIVTTKWSQLHSAIYAPTARPMRKLKLYPTSAGSVTLRDWLPGASVTTANQMDTVRPLVASSGGSGGSSRAAPAVSSGNQMSFAGTTRLHDDEQVDGADSLGDLKMRSTTQAPIVYTTLPESGGNADLELPPSTVKAANNTNTTVTRVPKSTNNTAAPSSKATKPLDTAATTTSETADYVTAPSISTSAFDQAQNRAVGIAPHYPLGRFGSYPHERPNLTHLHRATAGRGEAEADVDSSRVNYFKDLNSSPIPLTQATPVSSTQGPEIMRLIDQMANHQHHSTRSPNDNTAKDSLTNLRSNLRWIYSSWFGIAILGANICGALLTLYVLTFLLMKNCDGSLDRENQGMRSIHLLSIIVVFFGSTLFIVYPTPGLCLLRTSWHNFALVMLFGSLLLHAMQTRSLGSLGLGGRPNRLNQFLTLVFMVGVQVSFELQRWKYESANYMNFVNQYFGSTETNHKLMILSNAIANQFNPLNAFNDQVTPVSIQVSEQYQNLLQDYCMQRADDFLSSQIYLCILVALLLIFSTSTRNARRNLSPGSSSTEAHHKLTSALSSGKLVASQHEANLNLTPSHFQFVGPNAISSGGFDTGNMFMVAVISAPIYSISIVLHLYIGQNSVNRDLISSLTMILIAFVALIGIFLPILLQIHRFNSLVADRLPGTLSRPVITQSKLQHDQSPSSPSTAFTMFPEFAPTGLRRPSSASGESSSGGSRRPFAETKESRRNMGAALANLGPTADSLRSMGFYEADRNGAGLDEPIDPAMLNLKLNLSANDSEPLHMMDDGCSYELNRHKPPHNPTRRVSDNNNNKSEKRLILLDVDPCCPRHGIGAARPRTTCNEPSSSASGKGGKTRTAHSHQ